MQTGNDERAVFFLSASLNSRAAQPDVHAALGDIYLRLSQDDKALDHLRKAVKLAPQAFHATLSRELGSAFFDRLNQNHPVSVGRGRPITLPAAWSIWVTEGGFHRTHVHTRGWYSSAYYVILPSELQGTGEKGNQGALAFGRPELEVPGKLGSDKIIAPAEGMLALFPSYFWHETLPYKSSEARVVVAFDALPAL